MSEARTRGPVRIVGAGLLGASIGLALRAKGVEVILDDVSPATVTLAIDYGAGRAAAPDDHPSLIVVCVPPDVTARTVAAELAAHPHALVTDVASVKLAPLTELRALGADVSRYIGSHPMAGRERGGAVSARADLFVGRPWVVANHDGIADRRTADLTIEALALDLGAVPIEMEAAEHDRSVALVSHVPQIISSLLAARLEDASDAAVGLAGQGLRDTTRIASSNPELWVQILTANAEPVVEVLRAYRDELDAVIASLSEHAAPGARRAIAEALAGGNAGVARIPGKHGQAKHFASLVIMVADRPGELARLLTEIGAAGVNMEDLRLEHSPGAQIGLAEIGVLPEVAGRLAEELESRGWKIAGAFS
ncbi:prephenate dehydrogenase [Galbitalea soli]|uniref:Prephenate dehydrogenase n=1 Tax=Galbitalea soli TaxID=1268042 RepID=A0A7C9TPY4_9MICO|nr:prephenate dehydrogenase [Galbitalea soli]NEM89923.1 prephenate dehydrogenase [Galbitalea soli]NYJ30629.1 prephenate dehydrogenase [Galbitalea soli]